MTDILIIDSRVVTFSTVRRV